MKSNFKRTSQFFLSLFLLLFVGLSPLKAQEQTENTEEHEGHFYRHRIAVFTGYGIISGAVDENGKKQPLIIPVIGFDYEYL